SYTITVYAYDDTVDVQHSSSSVPVSFVYETVPPTSAIQTPPQGAYYNVTSQPLTLLAGPASDLPGGVGSGISKVWVQIQYYGTDGIANTGDDLYWDGSSWSSSPAFSTASLTTNATAWYLPFSANNWFTGASAQYLVMTQAFDNGRGSVYPYTITGTREITPTIVGNPNYHYFIVDTTAPAAIIGVPNT